MSTKEIIDHWRKSALDSVEIAEIVLGAEKYDHALFQCQLATEKTLKVLHMIQHEADAPFLHDLEELANLLDIDFSKQERQLLRELTDFAVDARYHDPEWAQTEATKENAERYTASVSAFTRKYLL